VPWHAARRTEGPGYRYLAEEVALSVVPSAQLLCEVGSRNPDHPNGVVIVSNPTGDLRFAGTEAVAIQNSFYPSAVLLGLARTADGEWRRAPDGPGRADEVLGLIERGGASANLHLACHAIADQAQPSRSRLVLGDGEELPVRILLQRRRTELLLLDRVFLSACTTHVSGRDYDEAFSLSTAFLAAGARTVFGSLWQVMDGATSALMYMVHRFLQAGTAPVTALCLAQRWMLDPDRRIPAEMPNELVSSLVTTDLADPMVWAGFVHLGI
jgi:CHAT domain-containing protein